MLRGLCSADASARERRGTARAWPEFFVDKFTDAFERLVGPERRADYRGSCMHYRSLRYCLASAASTGRLLRQHYHAIRSTAYSAKLAGALVSPGADRATDRGGTLST